MRWNIIISFLACLILFLIQQFLISSPALISVFACLVIILGLKQAPGRLWYVVWGGFLLDIAYGLRGVSFLSLFLLYWLFNLLTLRLSVFNYLARLWLTMGGLAVWLLANYFLTWLFSLAGLLPPYAFSLDWAGLINYFLSNSLLIILLLLIFRKKTRELSYEAF